MTEAGVRRRCTSAHKFTMSATTQPGGYEILSVKVTLYYYPFFFPSSFFLFLAGQKRNEKKIYTATYIYSPHIYVLELYRRTACNSASLCELSTACQGIIIIIIGDGDYISLVSYFLVVSLWLAHEKGTRDRARGGNHQTTKFPFSFA